MKGNQPTLEAEVEEYFRTAPAGELVSKTTVEKGHCRIETRTYTASSKVDWIVSQRSYPGEPRFTTIKTLSAICPGTGCKRRDGTVCRQKAVLRCALLKQISRSWPFIWRIRHRSAPLPLLPLGWSPKKSVLHNTISAISAASWEAMIEPW